MKRNKKSHSRKVKRLLFLANRSAANGHMKQAIAHFEKVLLLDPSNADANNNLGNVYATMGDSTRAALYYQNTLKTDPDHVGACNNLGNVLMRTGRIGEALKNYKNAAARQPELPEAQNNLGLAYAALGEADAACASFEKALSLKPDYAAAHSNLLLSLNYFPDAEPESVYTAHTGFAKRHEATLQEHPVDWKNDRSPERRLKTGYISSDFREHSVAYFFQPIIENHDHSQFEIFCYSNFPRADAITQHIADAADHWRHIFRVSDDLVAEQIRQDEIDILIDLNGHTAMNCLQVFARKPAPVQITWLGYPNTTGLASMDYRITDNYADPPGVTDAFHSEHLLRLPACFSCFRPPDEAPLPNDLPALENGYVTFGSFNKLNKLNASVIDVWARILKLVPDAHFKLKSAGFVDPVVRERVYASFARHEIAAERLELLGFTHSRREHLVKYQGVDIALDTFPYNGTTTTCEALWMGVPVISLAGRVHAGRVGVTQLYNLGLQDLLAETTDDYVAIAIKLAEDLGLLSELRSNLRDLMRNSPLTDAKRFVADLQHLYREVWRTWCNSQAP